LASVDRHQGAKDAAQSGHVRFSLHFPFARGNREPNAHFLCVKHPLWKVDMFDRLENETDQSCNCRFHAVFEKLSVAVMARGFGI